MIWAIAMLVLGGLALLLVFGVVAAVLMDMSDVLDDVSDWERK